MAQDPENVARTVVGSSRVLRGAARLLSDRGAGSAWTGEKAIALSAVGRSVSGGSDRAAGLSLYGAVQRAATVLADLDGRPLMADRDVMNDVGEAIVAASRLDRHACPSLGARDLDVPLGEESRAKPLDKLQEQSAETIVRTLETAGALAAARGTSLSPADANAVRAVLDDVGSRADGTLANLSTAVAAAMEQQSGSRSDPVVLQYHVCASIVEGADLHRWLDEQADCGADAYVEEHGGEWGDASEFDDRVAVSRAEAAQTAAYPGGQLDLLSRGADPTGAIEVSPGVSVSHLLKNAVAHVDRSGDGQAPGDGVPLDAICRADALRLDAAAVAARAPAFGDPPDLDRAVRVMVDTVGELKVASNANPVWDSSVVVNDDVINTFEEVFHAFEESSAPHRAREAVDSARAAVVELQASDWDVHVASTAVQRLRESNAELRATLQPVPPQLPGSVPENPPKAPSSARHAASAADRGDRSSPSY